MELRDSMEHYMLPIFVLLNIIYSFSYKLRTLVCVLSNIH